METTLLPLAEMNEILPKILIVDDNPNNSRLLETSLSVEIEAQFIKAESGEEALSSITGEDIALAILDVDMPGMSGFELAELIHGEERTKHLPIIFLSAIFIDEPDILKGYTKGAVDYLTKPFTSTTLLHKTRVFLNLFNQRKKLEEEVIKRKKTEAELRETQAELENRVNTRTLELSKSNKALRTEMAEREKTREMLRSNEEKYRSMIESMIDMACITNKESKIVFANPAMMNQLGRNVTGELCYKALHHQDTPCAWCVWNDTKWEKHVRITIQSPRDNKHYQISNSLIHLADGTLHKLAIYRDITAEKEVEENLLDAKQKAEQANQAKSEFLSNISHELRTPLHHILGFAKIGMNKTGSLPDEEIKDFFSSILSSGNRLRLLLNNLLNLSRLESGKVNLLMSEVNLGEIVATSLSDCAKATQRKEISIAFEDPTFPTEVVCSFNHIRQVMNNLLENAVTSMPNGKSIFLSIEPAKMPSTISAPEESGDALCVKIKDQGIGIPEGELETIFDGFTQSSKSKTGAGGTGLGLTICREIIQAHRGIIRAENNPEGGSTFSFFLPNNPR
jgi:signal transduction histidine kinase/DNA-binding response OmpR family regulator